MNPTSLDPMWLPHDAAADTYVAFRGTFQLPRDAEVQIRIFGCHCFEAWLDENFLCEGPARCVPGHPEYELICSKLQSGEHVIAARVHHEGVSNRLIRGDTIPPFFACRLVQGQTDVDVAWSCLKLPGFIPQVRRISPCLGWIEWCDTSKNPHNWQAVSFDASDWAKPRQVETAIGPMRPLSSGPVNRLPHRLVPVAEGPLAETFGYERDDISTRFFLRDLSCKTQPPQGIWRRYDLGRVRLGRPCFVLDLPPGARVEWAMCEAMHHGRVSPYLTLSLGPTCNMDHYIARGGVQTFIPLTPKGGRFLEVHVKADPENIRFLEARFLERGYYDQAQGRFECSDPQLNTIWATGVETLRACAEDTIVDTPCRERGQWIGDSLSVGMEIAAAVFSDLRPFERTLRQSADAADARGLVAAMCSGECIYLPAYALQWITANIRYYELTGRRDHLEELFPSAVNTMAAFESVWHDKGLSAELGPNFIDWGYRVPGHGSDTAYNLHYLLALRSMIRWCRLLKKADEPAYVRMEQQAAALIKRRIQATLAENHDHWASIGCHGAVLALRAGIIEADQHKNAVQAVKRHIKACFPNNPNAPRLSDPQMQSQQVITPYFMHFALSTLIERGQIEFVIDQFHTCWGWMLQQGCTTWPEVFDLRWSHCHHWSGCPTWQLSRYMLGLHPRFDLGMNHYDFNFFPGSLTSASGNIPIPFTGSTIEVKWQRRSGFIEYTLKTDVPITLHAKSSWGRPQSSIKVKDQQSFQIPL